MIEPMTSNGSSASSEAVLPDRGVGSVRRAVKSLRDASLARGGFSERYRWWVSWVGIVCVGVLFFTMPQWMPATGFLITGDGVEACLYTILALGMVLVIGYCGQMMLATNALFGMGAYGLAILAVHAGLGPWEGLVISAVASGLLAGIIGVLIFRLRGHLLGLATLAIGYVGYIAFGTASITGGTAGISAGSAFSIGSLSFAGGSNAFFYLCAFAAVVALVLARNLVVSRSGRALIAVESSESAASSCGINATRYKVMAFVAGAVMAAVAGSLYAGYVGFVGPDSFSILLTVEILLMAVVGGMRSVWGCPFGVVLIIIVNKLLQTYGPRLIDVSPSDFTTIGFGLVLILVLLFMPNGVSGAARWVLGRVTGAENRVVEKDRCLGDAMRTRSRRLLRVGEKSEVGL